MKKQLFLFLFSLSTASMSAQHWSLTGNAGTSPATNYVGTSDSAPLVFRVNNQQAGRIEFTGTTLLGYQSGYNNAGTMNTGLGYRTLIWNSTGSSNTAVGATALYSNTTGGHNTAAGKGALIMNTTGSGNVSIGENALSTNAAGSNGVAIGYGALGNANSSSTAFNSDNIAIGSEALRGSATPSANTGTNNVAIGSQALSSITYASDNVAVGGSSLLANVSGHMNTATGNYSLYANTSGTLNTANGTSALYSNTDGTGNCAVGYHSLQMNVTGDNNTAIGKFSNISSSGLNNATALGASTTANASNKVRIGSSSVTVVEGQVAYTNPSDARFKRDIRTDVQGLDFILQLRPVSYTFDRSAFAHHIGENTEGRETELRELSSPRTVGFLAQEVEKSITETGFADFDAVHVPQNEQDNYGLAYSQFVVPLVKAVQELHAENQALREEMEALRDGSGQRMTSPKEPCGKATTQGALHVFPVPANDHIQVTLDQEMTGGSGTLQLFDALGSCLYSRKIPMLSTRFDLPLTEEWPAGNYTLVLHADGHDPLSTRCVIAR